MLRITIFVVSRNGLWNSVSGSLKPSSALNSPSLPCQTQVAKRQSIWIWAANSIGKLTKISNYFPSDIRLRSLRNFGIMCKNIAGEIANLWTSLNWLRRWFLTLIGESQGSMRHECFDHHFRQRCNPKACFGTSRFADRPTTMIVRFYGRFQSQSSTRAIEVCRQSILDRRSR